LFDWLVLHGTTFLSDLKSLSSELKIKSIHTHKQFFIFAPMRKGSVVFILFLAVSLIALGKEILSGKVIKVTDGDTITILNADLKQIKIRLHGIDTPEEKQDFGTRAKQFTSTLAFGKTVSVKVLNKDRYGRSVGMVFLPDGRSLNKELLRAGLAWHFKQYDKSTEFANLELAARTKKIGVWSMRNAIAPWEFRKMKRGKGKR